MSDTLVRTPADSRREIEFGADETRSVGEWTRFLVSSEVDRGGDLSMATAAVEAPQWPSVIRESFSALYGGPDDSEIVADGSRPPSWVRSVVETVSRAPEWHDLLARTRGDEWASGMATAMVTQRISSTVEQVAPSTDLRAADDRLRTLSDLLNSMRGELSDPPTAPEAEGIRQLTDRVAQAEADLAEAQTRNEAAATASDALRGRLRSLSGLAAVECTKRIDDIRAGLVGLGCGSSDGSSMTVNGPRDEIVNVLRSDEKVARIARMAGRLRAESARKRANRSTYAREQVSSIRTGNDVSRLLPSELVYLGDDDLELVLFRKLTESSALEYELTGNETKVKGPIVVCVDESWSMAGTCDEWAKAVVLTLCEAAARERRAFVVVHFDSNVRRVDRFVPRNGIAFGDLLDCVRHFSGGGTRIDRALSQALTEIRTASGPMAGADVVLISDGADNSECAITVEGLVEVGASLYGIAIGSSFPESLRDACESYVSISSTSLGSEGTIDAVLSL